MKEDKTIKFERRGKYPGVKIHLDREECEALVGKPHNIPLTTKAFELAAMIRKKLIRAIEEDPSILEERTEEEIKATLMKEYVESEKKLAHIKDGLDWKKVKVEVQK